MMYDTEHVCELLNSHDQKLTLYHPVDIRKQSTLEEVEKGEDHDGFEVECGTWIDRRLHQGL
jgi:hypothetical protein